MLALPLGNPPAIAQDITVDELPSLLADQTTGLRLGKMEGQPPAAEVTREGVRIGYVFSTRAVTGSLGYGGQPIDIHVGLTVDGRITGARLVAHAEPILVIGVSPKSLEQFVGSLAGADIRQSISVHAKALRERGLPDHVAGATVSSTVIKDAVLRSARSVAQSRNLFGAKAPVAQIDRSAFDSRTWNDLLRDGAVARLVLTRGDVEPGTAGKNDQAMQRFVELYATLLTPPTIGQNLLGRRNYEALMGRLAGDEHAILIAATGAYSFKGTAWRQSGVFERIQIVQGTLTIPLEADRHETVEALAVGDAAELREIGLFRLPGGVGFDPTKPWRVDFVIDGAGAHGAGRPRIHALTFTLPSSFIVAPREASPTMVTTSGPAAAPRQPQAKPEPSGPPPGAVTTAPAPASEEVAPEPPELWIEIWRARQVEIAITAIMLLALATILFSHDLLVRDVKRYRITRLSFLTATVVFLGFYAGAQLSVINVITFVHTMLSGFKWDQFLLDPLVFMLWGFVAVALLFWGRGVFCGWLCPFGALQELLSEAARLFKVRQIAIPWPVHERLWPIKYVAFLVILGVSFRSITQTYTLAEVEPFKTAITLRFVRAWPFVVYSLVLLAGGLFIERLYCRYLCPLGAALAIPAKLRLFEWLKRRTQCGRECRVCATTCTVQAINPLGAIVPNECIYCLQCQTNLYDAKTCLPLKQRAMRRSVNQPAAVKLSPPQEAKND